MCDAKRILYPKSHHPNWEIHVSIGNFKILKHDGYSPTMQVHDSYRRASIIHLKQDLQFHCSMKVCWNSSAIIKKVKPHQRDHSLKHVSNTMRKSECNKKEDHIASVERTSSEWRKLQFMAMDTFKRWRKINAFKCKDDANIKKHKHWLTRRSDMHMQFHDQGERCNMSKLIKLSYRNKWRQIHKRKFWSKFHHFSYQNIRINGVFHEWEKC